MPNTICQLLDSIMNLGGIVARWKALYKVAGCKKLLIVELFGEREPEIESNRTKRETQFSIFQRFAEENCAALRVRPGEQSLKEMF